MSDLIVCGGPVYTGEGWAEAFLVRDGRITAVGTEADVRTAVGDGAETLDLAGRTAFPGLIDGHLHLALGGTQLAFELPLLPSDGVEEILAKVAAWTERLQPGEWVIGGIVGSETLPGFDSVEVLARLDEASAGHPVLLRDDTMHNRVVNSAALAAMGVGEGTPDPEGGRYVRDAEGHLTGVLWELAGAVAEGTAAASHADPAGRLRDAMSASLRLLASVGITTAQDAATMTPHFEALAALEADGALTARVVTSTPARDFIEAGTVGAELHEVAATYRSERIRPDFVKFVLDGVPTTRTTAMLTPYPCHHAGDEEGLLAETLWTLPDLIEGLRDARQRGLGAKMHATGDASVRLALDAAEAVRADPDGGDQILQIAHMSFIAEEDVPRFPALAVNADACPFMWHPSPLTDAVSHFVQDEPWSRIWPFRDLLDAGARVVGGSDWPVGLPGYNPWTGIETMVTRRSLDDDPTQGEVNPGQAIGLEEAIRAFTSDSARALGLAEETGAIAVGLSADFLVLDANPFEAPVTDLHRTPVAETWLAGRRVYARGEG